MSNDQSESYHSFLKALKGRNVTIYRGGPESKTGKLVDVKSDYIALAASNNNNKNNNNDSNNDENANSSKNNQSNVIYYQVQHVKSISEDTKSNSMQMVGTEEEEIEFFQAESFLDLLQNLEGADVKINQGGPESKQGVLVGIAGDFLILYTEDDGIVYTNIQHVKSVAEYSKNEDKNEDESGNEGSNEAKNGKEIEEEVLVVPSFVSSGSFQDVFKHFSHQWVAINRGGPEAMEGILVESEGGHYTLVNNQEVMRILPYHIKSISGGAKGSFTPYQNNSNKNENSNNNQGNSNQESNQNQNQNQSQNQNQNNENKSSGKTKRRNKYGKRSNGAPNGNQSSNTGKSSQSRSESVVKSVNYTWKSDK